MVQNIAVYGGSFDPPHLGHVMVVSHLLLNEPTIDTIMVVPCFLQTGKHLSEFSHRYELCRRAFGWLPRVVVTSLEGRLGGESVTLRTMQHLQQAYPEAKLRFVMGSDLLESAPSWEGWEELVKISPPLVVGRAGITCPDGPTPISPVVSSSLVRQALREGAYAEAERYLPRTVLQYIQELRLYEDGEHLGLQECVGIEINRANGTT